jgi:hypothetical protein
MAYATLPRVATTVLVGMALTFGPVAASAQSQSRTNCQAGAPGCVLPVTDEPIRPADSLPAPTTTGPVDVPPHRGLGLWPLLIGGGLAALLILLLANDDDDEAMSP